jgi:hypothetical protein
MSFLFCGWCWEDSPLQRTLAELLHCTLRENLRAVFISSTKKWHCCQPHLAAMAFCKPVLNGTAGRFSMLAATASVLQGQMEK